MRTYSKCPVVKIIYAFLLVFLTMFAISNPVISDFKFISKINTSNLFFLTNSITSFALEDSKIIEASILCLINIDSNILESLERTEALSSHKTKFNIYASYR